MEGSPKRTSGFAAGAVRTRGAGNIHSVSLLAETMKSFRIRV